MEQSFRNDAASPKGRPPSEKPAGATDRCTHILQFAASMHNEVARTLSAVIGAIQHPTIRQTVIRLRDDDQQWLFDQLPNSVVQHCAASVRDGVIGRCLALAATLRRVLAEQRVDVIHCHGYGPAVIARIVLSGATNAPRLLYTPHGSRAVMRYPWATRFIEWLLPRLIGDQTLVPVAFTRSEGRVLGDVGTPADLAEPAVADEYFAATRRPATPSIVITAGEHGHESEAQLFTRIAVLLSGFDPPLRFSWMGLPDADVQARLKAAGVNVFEPRDDADAARILAQATVHLQTAYSPRFSLGVAQAMAIGLPVVALDTPPYRDMIRDGQTGYLCSDELQFVERLLDLVRDEGLRGRIGDAARAEAQRRFHGQRFRASLLRACGIDIAPDIAEVHHMPTRTEPRDSEANGVDGLSTSPKSRVAR